MHSFFLSFFWPFCPFSSFFFSFLWTSFSSFLPAFLLFFLPYSFLLLALGPNYPLPGFLTNGSFSCLEPLFITPPRSVGYQIATSEQYSFTKEMERMQERCSLCWHKRSCQLFTRDLLLRGHYDLQRVESFIPLASEFCVVHFEMVRRQLICEAVCHLSCDYDPFYAWPRPWVEQPPQVDVIWCAESVGQSTPDKLAAWKSRKVWIALASSPWRAGKNIVLVNHACSWQLLFFALLCAFWRRSIPKKSAGLI